MNYFRWTLCGNLLPASHHSWLCLVSPDASPESGEEEDSGQEEEISGWTVGGRGPSGDETEPPGVSGELINSGRKSIFQLYCVLLSIDYIVLTKMISVTLYTVEFIILIDSTVQGKSNE